MELKNINCLPWDRIAHWYGRGGNLPEIIRDLGNGNHAWAVRELELKLEHQDGLHQATPFAVFFIIEMLQKNTVRDHAAVWEILCKFDETAAFQMRSDKPVPVLLDWNQLLEERRLLPVYIDEYNDEILWEEWDPSYEEWYSWCALTRQLIRSAYPDFPEKQSA
ncbi:hypothetical protein ACO0LC_22000 [Undibacterium sp. JH2W]|uniref:hypothetical protein n=1 Tax=Undibacterium sp. JH2W TaxID=3413037 RepID=UPI003BF3FB5E